MNPPTAWDDEGLLAALDRYAAELSGQPYSQITVDSYVAYGRRFVLWRMALYAARGMPLPARRPVPAGKRDLAGLVRELKDYEAYLKSASLKPGAIVTYIRDGGRFVDWLGGRQRRRTGVRRTSTLPRARPAHVDLSSRRGGLEDEFARIGGNHREAIVRTVARMAVPGSVGRVFAPGTTAALLDLLPRLPVARLPQLSGQAEYRAWFEAALKSVATAILQLNPPGPRSSVHPGYKWGHGTKVLSLFVRDLVLFSRYFTEDEAKRIEAWLYCPVDQIVMTGLRRAGFDPAVDRIRLIDQAAFWRIQDALSRAAKTAGVPTVWFDDVWSDDRN